MHARRPVRRVGASLCWERQYERALHPHVPKVVGEAFCCSCLVRTTVRGRVNWSRRKLAGARRRRRGSCSCSTGLTRCRASMLRRSLKDFQPMSPTMPFSMSPDQPLHWHCTGHHFRIFEVYKTGEVQRFSWAPERRRAREEYWDKSGLLCIIVKQDNDDDPIANVSAASHGDPPLTQAEELTKPTHYISGGLSLDHHLLYADMLDGWRWHEFGVTGPTAEAALTSMESCNHRS
ncbi:hypothetical protein EDB83DRAFT_2315396 [Lactarius deliciosus]|nr:hypothetical protein EDB83DRAFT_2315396 [Lactarius deliciosus]